MILATLEYGCCGGPDTARFYAEDGTYLGSLEGFELQRGANYGNVIRRTFDMKNSTENYLLVSAAGATGTFEALVLDGNKPIQKLPVLFIVSDKDACDYWHIGEFVKYGDRDVITLKVKGSFCSKEVQEEQEFSCVRKATGISCVHLGQGK